MKRTTLSELICCTSELWVASKVPLTITSQVLVSFPYLFSFFSLCSFFCFFVGFLYAVRAVTLSLKRTITAAEKKCVYTQTTLNLNAKTEVNQQRTSCHGLGHEKKKTMFVIFWAAIIKTKTRKKKERKGKKTTKTKTTTKLGTSVKRYSWLKLDSPLWLHYWKRLIRPKQCF